MYLQIYLIITGTYSIISLKTLSVLLLLMEVLLVLLLLLVLLFQYALSEDGCILVECFCVGLNRPVSGELGQRWLVIATVSWMDRQQGQIEFSIHLPTVTFAMEATPQV